MLAVLLSVVVLLGLLFLGMPVFGAILAALLVALPLWGMSPTVIPVSAFFSLDSFLLLAVPMFILAGALMTRGGMSTRLIAFINVLVGKIKGGLAHVAVVTTLFFGTITGSGLAAVAAIGEVMIPKMEEYGWDKRYSTALVAASGPLGYLIPPSIMGILYAFVSGVSVAKMFLAPVVPAIITAMGFMAVNYFWGAAKWYHPVSLKNTEKEVGWAREMARTGRVAFPALFTPIIILGGIYGGIFTPTEAAGVACVYALIAGVLIYRGLTIRFIYRAFLETSVITGVVFLMVVAVVPYTKVLIMEGVVGGMTESLLGISSNPYVILLMLNVALLILGMFIDTIPILIAIVPLLLPLASVVGVDPLHLGTIILVNLGIGCMTPPFAINLMTACKLSNIRYHEALRPGMVLTLFVSVPALLLTTYIPQLSLWLPNLIMGSGQ